MTVWLGCAGLCGFYPLYRAWRGAGHLPLASTLVWACLAWICWCAALTWPSIGLVYLALSLTACAGVSVLGARRGRAGAWNFVVLCLLAALCRPFLEGFGEARLEAVHLLFLGIILAIAILNYLPTRFFLAMIALGAGCSVGIAFCKWEVDPSWIGVIVVAPWLGWLTKEMGSPARSEADALWKQFRDGYGFLWGQRLREQYNRALYNAGFQMRLRWNGLEGDLPSVDPEGPLRLLRAILKQFLSAVDGPPAPGELG